MVKTCLNCGHTLKGNFCSFCGQKATVKRITPAVFFADVLHFFTHLEKGFLFTTWNFSLRPGISSLNYLSGKRKVYQSPVSYLLIWTGVFFLLHNGIINYFHFQLTGGSGNQADTSEEANMIFRQHFTFFIFPVIIISALILYYIMGRPRYYYIELLALSFYGTGTYFMMSVISDFILGFIFRVNILATGVFLFQGVLSSVYNFWFSFDFFKRIPLKFFWVRLIITSILVAVCGWIIMFYLPEAWIYYTMNYK